MVLSVEEIIAHVRSREAHEVSAFSCERKQYAAAELVLRTFLGERWLSSHLQQKKMPSFFHPTKTAPQDDFKLMARAVALAECLFNLQTVDGIANAIKELLHDTVETAVAKLECVALLHKSALPVRIVLERGKKHHDFDAEVIIGETRVACEIKAKLETTKLTATSVENSIDTARDQLPDNQPTIVFLRIPEVWTRHQHWTTLVDSGIKAALAKTGRITAVVIQYEIWHPMQGGMGQAFGFRIVKNARARIALDAIAQAINSWPRSLASGWTDFGLLLCPEEKDRLRGYHPELANLVRWRERPTVEIRFAVSYHGDFGALFTAEHGPLKTEVDFRAQPGLLGLTPGMLAHIDVTEGRVRNCRLINCTTAPDYKLVVDSPILNPRWRSGDLRPSAEKIEQEGELLQRGILPVIDADPVLSMLRELFDAMRRAGDLSQPLVDISDVLVSYRRRDEPPIAQIVYHEQRFVL